jgi:hypothetical protein
LFGSHILRATGVDLSGHGGVVTMRLLHDNGYLDVPMALRHAAALADALNDTAHEMAD